MLLRDKFIVVMYNNAGVALIQETRELRWLHQEQMNLTQGLIVFVQCPPPVFEQPVAGIASTKRNKHNLHSLPVMEVRELCLAENLKPLLVVTFYKWNYNVQSIIPLMLCEYVTSPHTLIIEITKDCFSDIV